MPRSTVHDRPGARRRRAPTASTPRSVRSSRRPGKSASSPTAPSSTASVSRPARPCDNVLAVLAAGGAREQDIISVRVFLTDVSHFEEMNAVYETVFSEPRPARTTVYVGLPSGTAGGDRRARRDR